MATAVAVVMDDAAAMEDMATDVILSCHSEPRFEISYLDQARTIRPLDSSCLVEGTFAE